MTKTRLQNYARNEAMVHHYQERITELMQKAGIRALPPPSSIQQMRKNGAPHEKYILQAVELDERMQALVIENSEVEAWIYNIADPTVLDIFRMRYMEECEWRDIAKALHYSEQHCFKIHSDYCREVGIL